MYTFVPFSANLTQVGPKSDIPDYLKKYFRDYRFDHQFGQIWDFLR